MALRLDGIFTKIEPVSWLTLVVVAPTTIFLFARIGLYNSVVRYMAERAVKSILFGSAISSLIMLATSQYLSLEVPRSVPGIYFSLLVLTIGGTRLAMRTLDMASRSTGSSSVLIYGAGRTGRLLMSSLRESQVHQAVLFIDDDKQLQGTIIDETPIKSLHQAKETIEREGIAIALIAIDEDTEQRKAARQMAELGLEVRIVPKVADLVSGTFNIHNLRKVKVEELLGRDPVNPEPSLMSQTIRGKSVLITGAGGSIGSELCRQAIQNAPRRLTLIDLSEYALYSILEELTDIIESDKLEVELVPVLGSVANKEMIERVIVANKIETLYHAAAYKHVPLVEYNASEALHNNVQGTLIVAHAAGRHNVKNFTLISTDKAVRPTNVMGATKRLAELAIQEAANKHLNTKFCAVRFGNVLGSSGSVVPKFEKQILRGGPITLTHEDITRYFMTIPEAAQLVIQASAISQGGEIFLLDMGEPIRILDLARTMCALHGKKLLEGEPVNATSDAIKLEIIGLRQGEKLYEELLVTGLEAPTLHPRIMCEQLSAQSSFSVEGIFEDLSSLSNNNEVIKFLASLPIDYAFDSRHHALRRTS